MKQNKEKRIERNKDSLRYLWDNVKCTNIHITGVPEVRKKGLNKIFEGIIAENLPNIGKEAVSQVQEAENFIQDLNQGGTL